MDRLKPVEKLVPGERYPVLDTDLAIDNIENDMTFADLQDLHGENVKLSNCKTTDFLL